MINKLRTLSITGLFFLGLAFGSGNIAHAQATDPVSKIHSYGQWDLVEIKDTADSVMGFWAIPRIDVEVGNIRRLWFEALPGEEWNVWAFEPVAIFEKIDNLLLDGASDDSIDILNYRESIAADTATNLDVDGGIDGLVVKGFIEGDPLTEAAGSLSDPSVMIDLLADIGYPIAPGMSDLMVSGTAGVNVGMNPATKQSLDCLRSGGDTCSECICSRAGGTIEVTPWEVDDGVWVDFHTRLRCTYTRIETHTYWKTGIDPDTCDNCTAGSEDEPLINVVERTLIIHWYDETSCPATPGG